MIKIVVLGTTALFLAASPVAIAQTTSPATQERLSPAEQNQLTDMRIDLVKAALQLTPDQTKYWPPIENAIRARAEYRQARLSQIAETMAMRAGESSADVMGNRDPVAFLNHRADVLAKRSSDLKGLAEAWQPLYQTLSPEQKKRMATLAILVLHDLSDAVDRRRAQADEDD